MQLINLRTLTRKGTLQRNHCQKMQCDRATGAWKLLRDSEFGIRNSDSLSSAGHVRAACMDYAAFVHDHCIIHHSLKITQKTSDSHMQDHGTYRAYTYTHTDQYKNHSYHVLLDLSSCKYNTRGSLASEHEIHAQCTRLHATCTGKPHVLGTHISICFLGVSVHVIITHMDSEFLIVVHPSY